MYKYLTRTTILIVVSVFTLFLFSNTAKSFVESSFWDILNIELDSNLGELNSNLVPLDRFGNRLYAEDLRTSTPSVPSLAGGGEFCNCENGSGIFRLTFEDVCNERNYGFSDPIFGLERQAVVCRVFSDLSILLNPTGNIEPNHVRILIKESEGQDPQGMNINQLSDGTIAAASPVIFSGFSDGITPDMVMRAIQSNLDPYIGLDINDNSISPNSAHGLLQIDFENFDFFLNTNVIDPSPLDLHDLYTVVLHESLHLLGIYSLINAEANNQSLLSNEGGVRNYSKFDTYIRTRGGINNTSNNTPNYINYPTSIPFEIEVASNSFIQTPLCSADAEYAGNALPFQELYLPFPWNGSGLSHLNCDNQNIPGLGCATNNGYVMNSCGPTGYNQRSPAPQEVSILCDIGYDLGTSYGTESFEEQDVIALAGELTLDTNGDYTFVPNPIFSGTVNIEYLVNDANGDNANGIFNLQIDDYEDNITYSNDNTNIGDGQILTGSFLANDYDPEGDDQDIISVSIDSNGDNILENIIPSAGIPIPLYTDDTGTIILAGNITIDPETGNYTWVSEPSFLGTIQIEYIVSDGMSEMSATLSLSLISSINTIIATDDQQQATNGFDLTGNPFIK